MTKALNSGIVGNRSANDCDVASVTRRFGAFELNLRAGELRRNGLKVKLQEQPFQILAQLLEKPGEVVTREDLRNRLWPADTFVDFDHSLNAAIRRLRDALGDSAENPTFVETVARRGYRFLAPVNTAPVIGNGASDPHLVSPAVDRSTPRFHLWWIAAALASVTLVLFGIKLGLSLAQRHSAAQAQFHVSRLTANPHDDRVRAAAISRDGKYLAFSDETGFYLRQIDTGETHFITLPAGLSVESLTWFPDSVHMCAALAESGPASSLWQVSVLGGDPRRLAADGRSPAISPDGNTVAFVKGTKMNSQIWLMAADGEQPRKLLGEPGDFFGSLAWSPDGARIAYVRGRLAFAYGMKGAIEFVDLRSQHAKLLQLNTQGWFASINGPLAWTREGLIYTLAEPSPRQLDSNLWSVSIDSRGNSTSAPLRLTSDPGAVNSISTSADGKRLVYVKGVPTLHVSRASANAWMLERP